MDQKTESFAVIARPADNELDMFGITHTGLKRQENQDHFLLATVHPQIVIHGSSLAGHAELPLRGSRLGTILLVADGVGGSTDGAAAAQLATESVTHYVASSLRSYHEMGAGQQPEFLTALREAAMRAHDAVCAEAATRPGNASLATTLTLGIGVWPRLYVVQNSPQGAPARRRARRRPLAAAREARDRGLYSTCPD